MKKFLAHIPAPAAVVMQTMKVQVLIVVFRRREECIKDKLGSFLGQCEEGGNVGKKRESMPLTYSF